MQAVKAYYDDGKFIPTQPVKIPNGSQAIVTMLDFPIYERIPIQNSATKNGEARMEWLNQLEMAIDLSQDESLPDMYFQRSKEMRPPLDLKD